ncbi:MAG: hypothetical protein AAF571_04895 [Verrucomicrobiota bacterium]
MMHANMNEEESPYPLRAQSDAFESPIAKGLERLVDFEPQAGVKGQRYVRLDISWAEFFYRMEDIGNCLICSTNGWARFHRHQLFSGWKRIPGENIWIQPETGTELHTDQIGSIIVVEQDSGDEMMLSIQLIHKNGHGHIKIVLSCESSLAAYYDLVRSRAVSGELPDTVKSCCKDKPVEVPSLSTMQALWSGACHSMPSETYPGCGSLARLAVLKRLDPTFVEPMSDSCLEPLIEQWIKYQCAVQLTLFHPDHQIHETVLPTEQCSCRSYWHFYGRQWQCHLPKSADLKFMLVHPKCDADGESWIEIYHEPTRRFLAWIRPDSDPIDRMHWKKSIKSVQSKLNL